MIAMIVFGTFTDPDFGNVFLHGAGNDFGDIAVFFNKFGGTASWNWPIMSETISIWLSQSGPAPIDNTGMLNSLVI